MSPAAAAAAEPTQCRGCVRRLNAQEAEQGGGAGRVGGRAACDQAGGWGRAPWGWPVRRGLHAKALGAASDHRGRQHI
eukprot:1154320-Pelagomonas_calceolata.AAC.1